MLYNESFWSLFVEKAVSGNRVETQSWDFKGALEMWHCREEKKPEFEVSFSEQVNSYANSTGGILLIGITDKPLRRVVGIQDLDNKMKFTKSAPDRCTGGNVGFVHFQQIKSLILREWVALAQV